ncbi:hypothetical protein ABZV67_38820 [Streptomyces sp. NPDC005065]|uniref:hypothetical protein n=1 Tax=unclassified Streptomyces TaxID=2593676 RepID=UPI0033A3457B
MRVRGVLTACLVVLTFWGAVQSTGGIINHGLSKEAICDGSNINPEHEEVGPVMDGDDRCFPRFGGDYRTYEQQRGFQRGKHQDVVVGAWCLGTGVAGVAGMSLTRCLRRRWNSARAPGAQASGSDFRTH